MLSRQLYAASHRQQHKLGMQCKLLNAQQFSSKMNPAMVQAEPGLHVGLCMQMGNSIIDTHREQANAQSQASIQQRMHAHHINAQKGKSCSEPPVV